VHLHCIITSPEVLAVVVHDSSLGCDVTSLDEWLWTFRKKLIAFISQEFGGPGLFCGGYIGMVNSTLEN